MKFINGGVYESIKPLPSAFVLVFNKGKWGMLFICRHWNNGMSCPIFQSNKEGKSFFTEKELRKEWNADNWKLLDGRLRIEKIDENSYVEWTNGMLSLLTKKIK